MILVYHCFKRFTRPKNIIKFNKLLKLLAEQSGQLLNVTSLAKTVGLAKQTVEEYLFILENTYIIKLVPPFSRSSKVEVNKAPKIFFYDTGLLQMLWLSSFANVNIGNIFETSVFAELVKKYGTENIRFWRNKNQNEIDFILKQRTEIISIEVKESFYNFRYSSMKPFLNNLCRQCVCFHPSTFSVIFLWPFQYRSLPQTPIYDFRKLRPPAPAPISQQIILSFLGS